MKKRKLVGSNNFTTRQDTFMEGEEVELRGYEDVYAVKEGSVIYTFTERFIEDKFYESFESKGDPHEMSFDFLESGEWEDWEC